MTNTDRIDAGALEKAARASIQATPGTGDIDQWFTGDHPGALAMVEAYTRAAITAYLAALPADTAEERIGLALYVEADRYYAEAEKSKDDTAKIRYYSYGHALKSASARILRGDFAAAPPPPAGGNTDTIQNGGKDNG